MSVKSGISKPVNNLLMAELESIRTENMHRTNGWRLVMLVQMPTFCGILAFSKENLVLFALVGIVIITLFIAESQRISSDKYILNFRNKIVHQLSEMDMDSFISSSYDYRFFYNGFPLSRLLYRLDLVWLSFSTIFCLELIKYSK